MPRPPSIKTTPSFDGPTNGVGIIDGGLRKRRLKVAEAPIDDQSGRIAHATTVSAWSTAGEAWPRPYVSDWASGAMSGSSTSGDACVAPAPTSSSMVFSS